MFGVGTPGAQLRQAHSIETPMAGARNRVNDKTAQLMKEARPFTMIIATFHFTLLSRLYLSSIFFHTCIQLMLAWHNYNEFWIAWLQQAYSSRHEERQSVEIRFEVRG
mmetsp:Transcript_23096/g.32989  ORF Transcript_23096/g.32989 Transcript_23096/m.32989 type:complete len:108 (+) Transcript_23096:50-373(+)